jgi:hypothetical protein
VSKSLDNFLSFRRKYLFYEAFFFAVLTCLSLHDRWSWGVYGFLTLMLLTIIEITIWQIMREKEEYGNKQTTKKKPIF